MHCARVASDAHADDATGAFRCDSCGEEFSLPALSATSGPPTDGGPAAPSFEGLTIIEGAGTIKPREHGGYREAQRGVATVTLRWPWRRELQVELVGMVAGPLFMLGLSVLVGVISGSSGGFATTMPRFLLLVVQLVWVVVALINHTEFILGERTLIVRNRPFPWLGAGPFALEQVVKTGGRGGGSYGRGSGRRSFYGLWAALRDGRTVKLDARLRDSDAASFIQGELVRRLGLPARDDRMPLPLP